MKCMSNFSPKQKKWMYGLLIFLLLFSLVPILSPFPHVFEYSSDEGTNLMKAVLLGQGVPLYEDIISDQPPLFTVMLSFWIKVFSHSVFHARVLILIFSMLLIVVLYRLVKYDWGKLGALSACVFLVLSAYYLRLSVSILIGLPALALAMLSLYFVFLYRRHLSLWMVILSGILFAISTQTKFFTMFLLPLILIKLSKKRLPLITWFGSFSVVYGFIMLVFFKGNLSAISEQLFQPHLQEFNLSCNNFAVMWQMLMTDFDIALLAVVGIICIIAHKKWSALFPVGWIIISTIILWNHRPVWRHHYLLISIPLCWLAGIGFAGFMQNRKKVLPVFRWLMIVVIAIVVLRMPAKYLRMKRSVDVPLNSGKEEMLKVIQTYQPHVNWMTTDNSIFAFYADIGIPPELALVTRKRNFLSETQQEYFIQQLKKYKPELIVWSDAQRNWSLGPKGLAFIEENYTKITQQTIHEKWVDKNFVLVDSPLSISNIKTYGRKMWFHLRRKENNKKLGYHDFFIKNIDHLSDLYAQGLKTGDVPKAGVVSLPINVNLFGGVSLLPADKAKTVWARSFTNATDRKLCVEIFINVFNDWIQLKNDKRRLVIRSKTDAFHAVINQLESLKQHVVNERQKYTWDYFFGTTDSVLDLTDNYEIILYVRKGHRL